MVSSSFFYKVCFGNNQDLGVGIYFKPPSLHIREGIPSGWRERKKKAIVCGFPIILCESL